MLFSARVVENRPLGRGSFILGLDGCQALAGARPGQFVMVRGAWGRDPLLPRAFSILRLLPGGGCQLLVKAMGRATRLLQQIAVGASLSVLGPLGRPFPAPEPDRHDLLVAGGVGLAPLIWHAEVAAKISPSVTLFYGARSAADLVLLDEIAASGAVLHVATEDGSQGTRGRVTDVLATHTSGGTILTCGPNPMMKAVAALAAARGLTCHVSVEGEMACGIGACLGCALPTVGGERPFAYACVDGPVFDATRVVIP